MTDEPVSHDDAKTVDHQIKAPPTRFLGILGHLGPGLIIAGSIVGSGELIATTKTGAEAGFTLLWMSPHSLQTDTCAFPMPNEPYWLFILLFMSVLSQPFFSFMSSHFMAFPFFSTRHVLLLYL